MIYGGVGVWRALVPVFAGFALLCQRAILEQRSAAAMAKANDMEQWGYALTRHAALMLSVAINTHVHRVELAACLLASVLQAASARDFLNAGALEAVTRGRDLLKLVHCRACLLVSSSASNRIAPHQIAPDKRDVREKGP